MTDKLYTITSAAMSALRRHATIGDTHAIQQADGSWRVILSDEIIERARGHAIAGETLSDTMIRLCELAHNGGRVN